MIAFPTTMFLRLGSFLLGIGLLNLAAEPLREAPNLAAKPANQLVVSGNACGPTALLNAFRFGNEDWQRPLTNIQGGTDKAQIYTIIRESGMRPSKYLDDRSRWSRKGVSIADLCDMGNELTHGQFLPQLSQQVLFQKSGETPEKLLIRIQRLLDTSLRKGFPPILSLRRYVQRGDKWILLEAHFVTLRSLPKKLEKNARSFPVTYIDPWGGKIASGSISLPTSPIFATTLGATPCLEAVFPAAAVGKKLEKPGEQSVILLSAALGRW